MVQPPWRTEWRFLKNEKQSYRMTPGHRSREKQDPKGYIHHSVHCSTVYRSQDTEEPKFQSTEQWIKKMRCIKLHGIFPPLSSDTLVVILNTFKCNKHLRDPRNKIILLLKMTCIDS